MLIQNLRGNYSFLKGISPYSAGVVASPGYAIEHVGLRPPLLLGPGFETVENHLRLAGRPRFALCGVELRSPEPFSFQGFAKFNSTYVDILKDWDILQDGVNPVARTNVAPELYPPTEPVICGFSYTVPAANSPQTFVVAGAGELPEGSLDPHDVIRRGETSSGALLEKVRFVLGLMETRLQALGVAWSQATTVDVYTVHDIHPWLASEILARLGPSQLQGVTWHFARPPIVSIEYEMDLRGCISDLVLGNAIASAARFHFRDRSVLPSR
jgi:hypothetical protein